MTVANRPQKGSTVIVVMGQTGSGKSTFVRTATKNAEVVVGHHLESCTQGVMWYQIPGTNVYLVDTPGFDDTYKDDLTILGTIAQLLEDFFEDNVKTRGVIYMHDITDTRMKRSALKNIAMFTNIVGPENLSSCCLVTTKWSLQPESKSIANEEELRRNPNFWGMLESRGAAIRRFGDTYESAQEIWAPLSEGGSFTSRITEEYTRNNKPLASTSAGKVAGESLDETKKAYEQEIEVYKEQARKAREQHDRELAMAYDNERRKLEIEVEHLRQQQRLIEEQRDEERQRFFERLDSLGKQHEESIASIYEDDRKEKHARKVRQRTRRGRWIARAGTVMFVLSLPMTGPMTVAGIATLASVEAVCQIQKSVEDDDFGIRGFSS